MQQKKTQTNFEHKTRVRHGASTLQTHLYIYIYTIYNECMQYNSTTHVIEDTLLSIYIHTPFTTSVCSTIVQLMSQRIHFFIEVPVPSQESKPLCICVKGINFDSFYDFSIGFWNCFDNVVFFVFHSLAFQLLTMSIRTR